MKKTHRIFLEIHPEAEKEFPNIKDFLLNILTKSLDYIKHIEKDDLFEISVSIIDDEEIQKINHTYRDKDKPTDVLSFSQIEGEDFPKIKDQPLILGDILISYETCKRQSIEYEHSFYEELLRLVVHGLFHLLGYDHERSLEDEKIMQEKEQRLIEYIKKQVSIN
jgi:probable rRNA maturation factor